MLTVYKYSTALSGLLKAARRALTTVSLSQVPPPISRICWIVPSRVLPATRLDAAWPYTSELLIRKKGEKKKSIPTKYHIFESHSIYTQKRDFFTMNLILTDTHTSLAVEIGAAAAAGGADLL